MANKKFVVEYVIRAREKFSASAEKVTRATKTMKRSVDAAKRSMAALATKVRLARDQLKKVGKKMRKVGKDMTARLSVGILAIGGFALKAAADMETMEVAFTSMTGSAETASNVMKSLISFTARTPFQLEGVGRAAKQLLSFGVGADDLESKLKFLGDIAAGANVPLTDMAAIFGKSKAKGKAMTEELLQLSDRGIPIIAVLSKQLGVSKEAIFELASKGKIKFGILEKAMQSMAAEGGIFANQMDKQSKTLAGIFSTLKDNINLVLADLGLFIVDTFDLKSVMTSLIVKVQGMAEKFKAFTAENPKLSKMILITIALLAVLGPVLIVVGLIASGVSAVFAAFAVIVPVLTAIGTVLAAIVAAVGIIPVVIGAVAIGLGIWLSTLQPVRDFFSGIWDMMKNMADSKLFNLLARAASFTPTGLAVNAAKGFFGGGQTSPAEISSVNKVDVGVNVGLAPGLQTTGAPQVNSTNARRTDVGVGAAL